MTHRQPEVGSAVGATTDQTAQYARDRGKMLAALRHDLTSELAKAINELTDRRPPSDVAVRLHEATHGMLERWRS
jgi:hypothetical protein